MDIGVINTQWQICCDQFRATSTQVKKVGENNDSVNKILLKREVNRLQQELAIFENLLPDKTPAPNSIEDLTRRLFTLRDPDLTDPCHSLENAPLPPGQKRKCQTTSIESSSSSSSSSKRTRRSSGVITLEELRQSIRLEPDRLSSVKELQKCNTIEEKIKLLFTWEEQSARLQVRSCFHQGFYLQKLKDNHSYSTSDLKEKFPKIGEYGIKRNIQLFNRLGNFRKILYSTIAVSSLWSSITSLEKELKQLTPEERDWWKAAETSDPSCFLKVYKEWFQHDISKNIFYELDIIDNNLNQDTDPNIIEQLRIVIKSFQDMKIQNLPELMKDLPHTRYMLWYDKKNSSAARTVCINGTAGNIWNSNDTDFQNDWKNNITFTGLEICVLKE